MVVTISEDNLLVFDNGLKIIGEGDKECCEYNYLDFEQISVGTEFEDMTLEDFHAAIRIKYDGFSIKDASGIPKWVQARSLQNGYYSYMTTLVLEQGEKRITSETFEGIEN